MIYRLVGVPGCGCVAIVTGIGRADVRGALASRSDAIVAACTGSCDARVIEHRTSPD